MQMPPWSMFLMSSTNLPYGVLFIGSSQFVLNVSVSNGRFYSIMAVMCVGKLP